MRNCSATREEYKIKVTTRHLVLWEIIQYCYSLINHDMWARTPLYITPLVESEHKRAVAY